MERLFVCFFLGGGGGKGLEACLLVGSSSVSLEQRDDSQWLGSPQQELQSKPHYDRFKQCCSKQALEEIAPSTPRGDCMGEAFREVLGRMLTGF